MSQLEAYRGIFIQSNESNEEFIKACIRELQPVCSSPIKRVLPYTSNGVQMYFEEQKTVLSVLSRKVLLVSGKRCHMCPLVTHLTIHKVIPTTEHDIQRKLSDKLQRYLGPVLKINELPVSEEYPAIGSGNWRVIIEIPELEALKRFQNFQKKNKKSLNETSIEFYYAEDGMKLSFFCQKCKKDGHISQHCKMLFKRKIKLNINKPSGVNIRSNTCFQKDAVVSTSTASINKIQGQTFHETIGQLKREKCGTSMDKPSKRRSEDDRNTLRAPSFSQPVTTPYTKNIHSSVTVKSELRSEDDRNALIAASFSERVTAPSTKSIHSSVTVKSESQSDVQNTLRVPSFSQPVTIPSTKNLLSSATVKSESQSEVQNTLRAPSFSQPVTTSLTKSIRSSLTVKIEPRSEDDRNILRAASVSQRVITPPTKNIHSSFTIKSESQSKDVQNTSKTPCFSQRVTTQPTKCIVSSVTVKNEPQSEDLQNTLRAPSCSHPVITPPARSIYSSADVKSESRNPRRRNSVIGEIKILPNSRTEDCIQKAGGACRLSQPQLETFFNHVKGKKNIFRILKLHKEIHKISEKALRQQLNEIVRLYHVSRLPETKEDKSLIKWLQCLVERLNKKRP